MCYDFDRIGYNQQLNMFVTATNIHFEGELQPLQPECVIMVRLKTRYIVVEVAAARKLAAQRDDIHNAIRESIAHSHGDYGVGMLQYAFQGAV